MTPMEKIEKRPRAPPEKVFKKPRRLFDCALKMARIASEFTPGMGMAAPTRKSAIAPSVMAMRLRRSGTSMRSPIPAILGLRDLALHDLGLAAGLLDLVLGALGERVHHDLESALELAVAQHLDRTPALD